MYRKTPQGRDFVAGFPIAKTLLDIYAANGADTPLLLSPSLGCQVLSSYIYDAQKARSGLPVVVGVWRDIDHWSRTLQGRALTEAEKSFLAGRQRPQLDHHRNIPIFVAAHKEMTIIPISAPRPSFRWLNLYDPAGVLGWPLQPLSEGYRLLVEDRGVNVGHGVTDWLARNWNPLSHSCYWDDEAVIAPLAAMLTQLMR